MSKVVPLKQAVKARYRRTYTRMLAPDGTPAGRIPRTVSTHVRYWTGFRAGAQHTIRELQDIGTIPKW